MRLFKLVFEIAENDKGEIFIHKDGIYTHLKDNKQNNTLLWMLKTDLKQTLKLNHESRQIKRKLRV